MSGTARLWINPDEVGADAARVLRLRDRMAASWDSPGFLNVHLPAPGESLAFATLNGEWGYDHLRPGGMNDAGGLDEILPLTATVDDVIDYVRRAVAFHLRGPRSTARAA